ncbi:CaiB/BaiF CoA transferase family protein [Paenarthrobacter aurescens]|uniref:CaiB/BaiF CoA transferase family protein n=1 Tax=Paenarthrobacter aurescens TaxID=43663 RepID=UPI0035EC9772
MINPLDKSAQGPLAGLVVVDFTRALAGPLCTMLLGDMGATVIKVESLDGEESRTWKPPVFKDESSYFHAVNRNKYSMTLDLKKPSDKEKAHELADRADVFIHNFKPGSIEKFGLGYEDIRKTNESIIYTAISGFGTGPGKELLGYDVLVQGMAGLMDMNGESDGPAVRSGVSVFDLTTGMITAFGIMAAIRHRDLTGQGQLLENNLMSNAMLTMVNQYQVVATTTTVPSRNGREHLSIYPYNAFPTADGELIIATANNVQFTRLCEILGIPDIAEDPRFDSPEGRNINRRQLAVILERELARKPKGEWFELMRTAGLPCAPVQSVGEGFQTAIELGLEPVWETGNPGDIPTIRNPLKFSSTPATYRKQPPRLGEDNEAVTAWLESFREHGLPSSPSESTDQLQGS